MLRQIEMEQAMLMAHRQFLTGLEQSLKMLEEDIEQVAAVSEVCTNEWCKSAGDILDYLHKNIYSISEPRWADKEVSHKIHELRDRVKDLYVHFKEARA